MSFAHLAAKNFNRYERKDNARSAIGTRDHGQQQYQDGNPTIQNVSDWGFWALIGADFRLSLGLLFSASFHLQETHPNYVIG
jgi:hypothetical protein